jgi:hypothetical protein
MPVRVAATHAEVPFWRREARRHRGTPHGSAEVVYERGDACSRRLVITAPRRRLSVQLVDGIGDERDSVGQSR